MERPLATSVIFTISLLDSQSYDYSRNFDRMQP
eukprot:SAG22_NODE_14142_length_383_cov_0.908451_1_plen_32_part_10